MVEFIHAIAKKNFILIVNELKWLVQLQCYGGVLVELLLTSSCMLLECRIIFIWSELYTSETELFICLFWFIKVYKLFSYGCFIGVTWGLSFMYLMDGKFLLA